MEENSVQSLQYQYCMNLDVAKGKINTYILCILGTKTKYQTLLIKSNIVKQVGIVNKNNYPTGDNQKNPQHRE